MNSKFLAIIQLHPHCYFIVPSASPSFENINGNLAIDNPGAGSSFPLSQCQIRIRIMNFRFCGRRKTRGLGEKRFGRIRTNNKLNPQVTPGLGIKPGPQWSEARALNISLSLLPVCSWIKYTFWFYLLKCFLNYSHLRTDLHWHCKNDHVSVRCNVWLKKVIWYGTILWLLSNNGCANFDFAGFLFKLHI